LESEISGLLGSIKVQASSLKETLRRQKSILTENEEEPNAKDEAPVDLSEIKIDIFESIDSKADSNLDVSINTVIQQEDDAYSSLNTSVISVIKVSDELDRLEGDESNTVVMVGDTKVAENLTLSISQFEMILSDLKTKHFAEKRMLQCDLTLCKKTI